MWKALFKVITMLLPFLKELIVGDNDVEETVRRNKMIAFMMISLLGMFVIFIYNYSELATVRRDLNDSRQSTAVDKATAEAGAKYIAILQSDLQLERQRTTCTAVTSNGALVQQNTELSAEVEGLKATIKTLLNDNNKHPGDKR
jgi:cell division protein FtsB